MQILEQDRADCEIIGYALDTLGNITSQEQFEEELDNPTVSVNVGEQFTEMFIKETQNVGLVLSYLEEYDFKVRWPAIKLLTILLAYRPKELQEIILVSPMAVSKLMDLLSDTREVIRNDALLLLIQLTKGNANIQKIVAFENAFDRLFDVIKEEGCSDGGIVVEDCLILMLNLLKNNSSNQQFFKEGSYIQRLAPMFVMPPELEETGWTPQKVSNVHCMLQVVRALISPAANSNLIITSCQKTMRMCGMLEALCNILMGSGVPADILTETINTVGEIVRGDQANQEQLSHVLAPSNPPRPAIVVLLMSMVNEKQPLPLRCAVLYCFECFLYQNETGQSGLVQTLLPSSTEVSSLTQGQLLCDGLFSTEPLANWFSATALMYGLIENPNQKEQLLRVLLATAVGGAPISLLHQCTTLLQQGKNVKSHVGLLMLLSTWLSHCSLGVRNFLSAPNSVAHLIAQIGANEHDENECLVQGLCAFLMGICIQFNDNSVQNHRKEDLCQLVVKRIGVEMFHRKLGEVSKHEGYSKAAKQPQIRLKSSQEVLLDYEFCKLFKALESVITKTISGFGSDNPVEMALSQEASSLVGQYKDIIREQDNKLSQLNQKLIAKDGEMESFRLKFEQSQFHQNQLQDQNILLKAQLTAATDLVNQLRSTSQVTSQVAAIDLGHSAHLESENQRLQRDLESVRNSLRETSDKVLENNREIEKMRKDQEDLLELLTDQDSKMSDYRRQLRNLGVQVENSDEDEEDDDDDDEEAAAGMGPIRDDPLDDLLQQQPHFQDIKNHNGDILNLK